MVPPTTPSRHFCFGRSILFSIIYFTNLSNGFLNNIILPSSIQRPFVIRIGSSSSSSSSTQKTIASSSPIVSFMSDSNDNGKNEPSSSSSESMSFDSAAQALKDQEDADRAERSGNKVSEEDIANFNAKKSQYEDMRSKIRDRASALNIEKSVTTAKAIEDANARAAMGEKPQLDLSQVTTGFSAYNPNNDDDEEEELTDDEKKEIDPVGQLPLWEQAASELQNTQFPTPLAALRQAGFMLVIFAVTATYILFLDEFLRDVITKFGLIPRPDEVFDFSDLALPEKWTEMMDEATDVLP